MPDRSSRAAAAARLLPVGLGGVAALAGAAAGAVAYYAGRLTERPADIVPQRLPDTRVTVLEDDDDSVLLGGPGAHWRGHWGVVFDDAHLLVGPVAGMATQHDGHAAARRPVLVRRGVVEVGREGHLSAFAYPDDPTVLGHPCQEVVVDSPVGPMPAWYLRPRGTDTAPVHQLLAVLVHGRSARRAETLRHAGPLLEAGVACLCISYRDDHEGAPSPDGLGHLGATEWEDVDAALRLGLRLGHRDLVLVGLSMGGALAVGALAHSALADRVVGLVLEAPVLDWAPVLREAARSRGIPGPLVPVLIPAAMSLAGRRAGIDFAELRALERAHVFQRPTLLLHGTADDVVPVTLSDTLAELHAETVTYVRIDGARHVACWNTNRHRVEHTLRGFAGALSARPH